MQKFLGEYSNGWGHLLMSLTSILFAGVLLIVSTDVNVKSLAVSVVTLIIGYWFGTGAMKKPAVQVTTPAPIHIKTPDARVQVTSIPGEQNEPDA